MKVNFWFFIYIAMFIPFGFAFDNWAMVMPGVIFALLFGLERDRKPGAGDLSGRGNDEGADGSARDALNKS